MCVCERVLLLIAQFVCSSVVDDADDDDDVDDGGENEEIYCCSLWIGECFLFLFCGWRLGWEKCIFDVRVVAP